jgi:acetyl esterase/lipase
MEDESMRVWLRGAVLRALFAAAVLLPAAAGGAQEERKRDGGKPNPDAVDVSYGPHERNVLDFWRAKGEGPRPVAVWIHGGGFRGGDKSSLPAPLLAGCLKEGISVAAIHYRLSKHAPFPAPMHDSGRAIQFLRSKAEAWNIDPARIAAMGGSAGAGISLWLGFHDDLADPKSDDPVARLSTRLSGMGVYGAQSTYDPRKIRELIGGRAHEHPALLPFYGLKEDELDTPKAHALYAEASAVTHLTADDPPAFLVYNEPDQPLPASAGPGDGIHHPRFGIFLKEKMDALKIGCELTYPGGPKSGAKGKDGHAETVEFLHRQLSGNDGKAGLK